jgi:hypothetical protein
VTFIGDLSNDPKWKWLILVGWLFLVASICLVAASHYQSAVVFTLAFQGEHKTSQLRGNLSQRLAWISGWPFGTGLLGLALFAWLNI